MKREPSSSDSPLPGTIRLGSSKSRAAFRSQLYKVQTGTRDRFRPERDALGKIQLHFEFQKALMKKIRLAAAEANLSSSDYVRKVVGLSCSRTQRPRISLSFGSEDLQILAERYSEPEASPQSLKRRVMEEVDQLLSEQNERRD